MNGENYYMKEFIANILRGMVIGISNVIPGVSGGTMMVSMGIYDKLILVLTHFIKRMKEAVALLVPIVIGMLLSIAIFAKIFSEILFPKFPLQTNLFFIGLIIGGLPVIYKRVKGNTIRLPQIIAFIVLFVVVVGFALVGEGSGSSVDVNFSVGNILKLFGVGVIAAATMVIPGVSGSMVMMILGYYNTIIDTINAFINALKDFDITAMLNTFIVLIPFGIGVVVGVVAVAKLIEFLLNKFPLVTYWAIIGLIAASPFAIIIMMDVATVGVVEIITGIVLLVAGFFISMKLGA
jgi:putative membrane protein